MATDQLPIFWRLAKNAIVWDVGGKRYIDFTSGIFTANVGHSHPDVIRAIRARRLLHTYTFAHAARSELLRRLTELTGYEKVFLLTTGSEAVEAALKIARGYTGRPNVIAWKGSFHGKTLGAQQLIHGGPGVGQLPFPKTETDRFLASTAFHFKDGPRPDSIAAVIFESYQAWNALFYPKQYVQSAARWCKRNGALLIFDEVQAGFGRTGKLFGFEHYDVRPDLVVCGKALGGGLPISAVLGRAELLDSDPELTSTHSGNPVCCAAALAMLDVLEKEKLVQRAARLGPLIEARLREMRFPVHGKGMVWSANLSDIKKADSICELAAKRGLLLLRTRRGTVKIGPPLTIPEKQLWEGLDILGEVIKELMA